MKHMKSEKNNKSVGAIIVEEAEKKIKEAKKNGFAVFCGGHSVVSFSKPKLKMDF